jgi:hypothetical protein
MAETLQMAPPMFFSVSSSKFDYFFLKMTKITKMAANFLLAINLAVFNYNNFNK